MNMNVGGSIVKTVWWYLSASQVLQESFTGLQVLLKGKLQNLKIQWEEIEQLQQKDFEIF